MASDTLRKALESLDQAVDRLESAVGRQEKKSVEQARKLSEALASQPRDLFGNPVASGARSGKGTGAGIDPILVANKLDRAIERVETILKDGSNG